MRLDFNVLWVDDQPGLVQPQINAIARHMEEHGFDFQPSICGSLEEVRQRITDNVFTDEVDLILVDYDLGHNTHGEQAIAIIRGEVRYKDVIFYSANKPVNELLGLASSNGLEGIFVAASRDGLVDEVMGVFESLVKKVLDLDHTRGIVMGATSDIDHIVNECLVIVHSKLDDKGKEKLLEQALKYIEEHLVQITEIVTGLKNAKTLEEFFKSHMIFTANDRLRMLGGALKGDSFKAHNGYRESVVAYQQEVVPYRNILGHLVLVPAGKPQQVVDSSGKPISVDKARELRKLLLRLRQDFRNLLSALQA